MSFKFIASLFIAHIFCFSPLLAKPQLVVYTYGSVASPYGAGPHLKAAFESQNECEIRWVVADTEMMLINRLHLEGTRTRADVILGVSSLDDSLPYDFTPYAKVCLAFIYDEKRIKNPPKSLPEIMDGDLKILLQDPRTSQPGLAFLYWIRTLYGERTPEIWKALQPHILTFTKGWSQAYTLFQQGEGDLVLSYVTSPLFHELKEGKTNFKSCDLSEGNMCFYERASIVNTSPLAREFLKFLTSEEGQEILATEGWVLPLEDIPAAWKNAQTFKDQDYAPTQMPLISYQDLISEWESALRGD